MRLQEAVSALSSDVENVVLSQTGQAQFEFCGEITTDSRKVQAGSCFIAIKGTQADGHQYLAQVCEKQPALILVEERERVPNDYQGICIQVENTRRAWALLAAQEYNHPSLELLSIGITGTNGKTSCTYMFEHFLNHLGVPCGVLGTIDHHLKSKVWKTSSTTPGPGELQARLREMKVQGAEAIAMEVSSHALDQHRVDQVHFDLALFTNLTRDHLDYHLTMDAYFEAKQRLFTELFWESKKVLPIAVVNLDDDWGRRIRVAQRARLVTYGRELSSPSLVDDRRGPDFRYQILNRNFEKIEFMLSWREDQLRVSLPMVGDHQVANMVGVLASVAVLFETRGTKSFSLSSLVQLVEDFPGVPGRLEAVKNKKGVHAFVDYAHSPDALENVLQSLKQIRAQAQLDSKIITVFGCGGDRDKGKRSMMAQIAEKHSDSVVITSDNPRTENPESILADIEKGFNDVSKVTKEVDRKQGIRKALELARPGDVVVVAGKGHEDYQEINGHRYTFRDQDVIREVCP